MNWVQRSTVRNWSAVAVSNNGSYFVATVAGGKIYASSGGSSWTEKGSDQNWRTIACDSTCTRMIAGVTDGTLYTSSDTGTTWTSRNSSALWRQVSSSSSGQYLMGVAFGSPVAYSSDYGHWADWLEISPPSAIPGADLHKAYMDLLPVLRALNLPEGRSAL